MFATDLSQLDVARLWDYSTPPELSVLIRCYNEIHALPNFWSALCRQTVFDKVEFVVLDSGSTDGSLDYFLLQPCTIYRVSPEHFNFGRSCNQLMALAHAPRACFLSAHVVLEQETALEQIIDVLDPQREQAAYLRQIPNLILGFNPYEAAYLKRRFPPGTSPLHLTRPAAFSNAASAITQKAWLEHPFPEIHGSEDHQWASEHLQRGRELLYLPHLVALHSHNETPAQIYKRVRLNVVARGQEGSYLKALFLFAGVFVETFRAGASLRQSFNFALSHAHAYL